MNAGTTVQKHNAYAAFRHRDFLFYLIGSLIGNIGAGAQSLAIGWEIYERTGQAMSLGLAGLAQAIPMLAFTLPAGYLADKINRKNLILISAAGAAATSVALAFLSMHNANVNWMFLLLFTGATIRTLGRPATSALFPSLVPRSDFENAVAWRTSTNQISSIAGPALGGFIILLGPSKAYLFAAVLSLCNLVFIMLLRTRPVETTNNESPVKATLEGIQFVWDRKLILSAISLDMFAVLLGGAVYLLPIYADTILHAGKTGLGFLRAAPALGALCTALFLAHSPPMKNAGRNLLLAVTGFGVVTIVFGLSTNVILSWAMLFLTGVFDNVSVVVRQTLVQMKTPASMRGRVSSVNAIFIGSSNELGGFESGAVAQLFTPVISVVSGGIGTIVVVVMTALFSPELRKYSSINEPSPEKKDNAVEPVTA